MNDSPIIDSQLLVIRRDLFSQYLDLESDPTPHELVVFQKHLADRVVEAEGQLAQSRGTSRDATVAIQNHIVSLRSYGDAIAWSALHPHVIRQLRRGGPRPPPLLGQLDSLRAALEQAKELAEQGKFMLLCDLTNDLRMGDAVLLDDFDAPTLIEMKRGGPPKNGPLLGRVGRQLSRLLSTTAYLAGGFQQLFGNDRPSLCIESDVEVGTHWNAVEEAVLRATDDGKSAVLAEAGQVLFCISGDFSDSDVLEFSRDLPRNAQPYIACHLCRYDKDPPLMPPPVCWPIDSEVRWLLSEGELVLFSLLDLNQFVVHAEARTRVMRLVPELAKFVVETRDGDVCLTSSFAERCGYCYSSVEDVVDLMLDFADQTSAATADPVKLRGQGERRGGTGKKGAPVVENLREIADVRDLLGRREDTLPSIVQVSTELINAFGGLRKRTPFVLTLYGTNRDEEGSTE